MKKDESEQILIPCSCGSLSHVVALQYIEWGDDCDPDLYIQTLHSPYLKWYRRIWEGLKYAAGFGNLPLDATVINRENADKIVALVNKYRSEADAFAARMAAKASKTSESGDSNGS